MPFNMMAGLSMNFTEVNLHSNLSELLCSSTISGSGCDDASLATTENKMLYKRFNNQFFNKMLIPSSGFVPIQPNRDIN